MRSPLIALVAAALLLAGCASQPAPYALPPADGTPDYQLGAAYPPPAGVDIVTRDRTETPPPDVYAICYINGFQTQPDDEWDATLLLRDAAGATITDPNWPDESLLDTSTADKRAQIADRMTPWIQGCAASGYDAVEFDNLDSHLRSDGALKFADNLALARILVERAHASGLAAGQKNTGEHSRQLRDAGFDFAVSEECALFAECGDYRDAYGSHVIEIEYSDTDLDFARACADGALLPSVVLRDRNLVGPDDAGYRFDTCAP